MKSLAQHYYLERGVIGSEHIHKATELQYDYKKRKNKTRNKYLDRELRSHIFKKWKRTPISVYN